MEYFLYFSDIWNCVEVLVRETEVRETAQPSATFFKPGWDGRIADICGSLFKPDKVVSDSYSFGRCLHVISPRSSGSLPHLGSISHSPAWNSCRYKRCSNIQTLVTCQKGINKLCRPRSDCFCSLIRVFPVCYSDKYFMNSSTDDQHFENRKRKVSV